MSPAAMSLEEQAERHDAHEILLAAIAALPDPRQQRILLWGFLGEMDDAELAELLGITRNHIHQLRHRALATLRADPALLARLRACLGEQ